MDTTRLSCRSLVAVRTFQAVPQAESQHFPRARNGLFTQQQDTYGTQMLQVALEQASTSTTTLHSDSIIRYKVLETSRWRQRKVLVQWEVTGAVSTVGQTPSPTSMSSIFLANIPFQRTTRSHPPSKRFPSRRMLRWIRSGGTEIRAMLPFFSTILVYNTRHPAFLSRKPMSISENVLTTQVMHKLQMGKNIGASHKKQR